MTMTQLESMLLSMVIEAAVAFALVAWRRWPGRGPAAASLAIVLATAATHPLLWHAALWLYDRIGFAATALLAESAVVLVEAAIVVWSACLAFRHALAVSVAGNAASVAAGLMLNG